MQYGLEMFTATRSASMVTICRETLHDLKLRLIYARSPKANEIRNLEIALLKLERRQAWYKRELGNGVLQQQIGAQVMATRANLLALKVEAER